MKLLLLTLWLACGTLHAAMTGNFGWEYEANTWRINADATGGVLGSTAYNNGTQFMQNIKRWDLRRFIKRANLYIGADTNTLRVCIINDWFSPPAGNDLLVAFTAADYSETNGLTGDTSSKYIVANGTQGGLGYLGNFTVRSNFHMAAYSRSGIGGTAGHIAGVVGAPGYYIMNIRNSSDVTTALISSGQPTAADTSGLGFYVSTRGSETLAHVYRNGTVFITDSTSMAGTDFPVVGYVIHAIQNGVTVGSFSSKTLSYYALGFAIPTDREVPYNLAVKHSQELAQRKIVP